MRRNGPPDLSALPPYPGDPVPPPSRFDLRFPEGFLWGCQTSATQVEGGNLDNDFIRWAQTDPAAIADHSVPLPGLDHWNRLAEDYAHLRANGHNAHSFTIDWSRIEPEEGRFDDVALAHYRREIEICRANGMEPIITLLHYAIPNWLAEQDGILNKRAPELFERFCGHVVEGVGDQVTWWNTLNEPNALAGMPYMLGLWPPMQSNLFKFFDAMGQTLRLHAAGARAIREVQNARGRRSMISIAHNLRPMHPQHRWNPLDWIVAKVPDYFVNRWFMNSIQLGRSQFGIGGGEEIPGLRGSLDFVGLDYYARDRVEVAINGNRGWISRSVPDPNRPQTTYPDDNTYDPDGLYEAAMNLWGQFRLPIMIQEFGCSDTTRRDAEGRLVDTLNPRYLIDFAAVMHHLIGRGVPIVGAMKWTDWDNWEWAQGWEPKFGLFSFDAATGAREDKFSAEVFRTLAMRNAIPASWLTLQNLQNPVERDRWAREAAEAAGLPGPAPAGTTQRQRPDRRLAG